MFKKPQKLLLPLLTISLFFLSVSFALAADGDTFGLAAGGQLGLGGASPIVVAVNVVRIILGFLGIVAVSLIIYGGWIYMASEGNAEKVEKAKNLLKAAVIGLVIIISAFGIASFIISRLSDATVLNNGETCITGENRSCGCGGSQVCVDAAWGVCVGSSCDDQGGIDFYIRNTDPNDGEDGVIRNIAIKAFLNRSLADTVDQVSLENNIKLEKIEQNIDPDTGAGDDIADEEIPISVSLSFSSSTINVLANSTCEILGTEYEHCLDEYSKYKVSINTNSALVDSNGIMLNDGNTYIFEFITSNTVDLGPPITGIIRAQICKDDGTLKLDANTVGGWASDDVGVSNIAFYQRLEGSSDELKYFEPAGSAKFYSTRHKYDTTAMNIGDIYSFQVQSEDVSGQFGAEEFTTEIKPGHCCNGVKDADEEEIDCGGDDCLQCAGGPCNQEEPNQCGDNESNCSDDLCASFFCDCQETDGCICENKPVIDWMSPIGGYCDDDLSQPCNEDNDCVSGTCNQENPNAKHDNLFTIGGRYFGTATGTVFFQKAGGGEVEAEFADSLNPECNVSWTDRQVIVVVPSDATNGSIKIESVSGYSDESTDSYGVPFPDFMVTGFDRPGLCKLDPNEAEQNNAVNYQGIDLLNSEPFFGKQNSPIITDFTNVDNKSLNVKVPNMANGKTSTFVRKDVSGVQVASNYLDFAKLKSDTDPVIYYFDPVKGKAGQYVTIFGRGFGDDQGGSTVSFGDIEASYKFPLVCTSSIWADDQVVVKVPDGITDNDYVIKMNIAGFGQINSSALPDNSTFKVDSSLPLSPGLCKVEPRVGLSGTEVGLWGEYFGDKDANSKVRFSINQDQAGTNIISWDKENAPEGLDPDKVLTTVPQSAQSGPVKIVKGDPKLESNGWDFYVGSCLEADDPDSICGASNICCPENSFREGECRATESECYFEVKNSVYEFEFSTGSSCPAGAEECGTSCCSSSAGGCEDLTLNQCVTCEADLNLCDDGNCCSSDCSDSDLDGSTECPDQSNLCSEVDIISGCTINTDGAIDQEASNEACDCVGYCDTNADNGNGICKDCTELSDEDTCSDVGAGRCCVDAKNGDACRGGDEALKDNEVIVNCSLTGSHAKCIGEEKEFDIPLDLDSMISFFLPDSIDFKENFQYVGTLNIKINVAEINDTVNFSANNIDAFKDGIKRIFNKKVLNDFNDDNDFFQIVINEKGGINYCAYYDCVDGACSSPQKTGTYESFGICDDSCGGGGPGSSCYSTTTEACTLQCSNPYTCIGADGCTSEDASNTCDSEDGSCLCCCDVAANNCFGDLNCREAEPCSGGDRGLCCGCSSDEQCGDENLVGCSNDTCCRERPKAIEEKPTADSNDVCRNTEISLKFDQLMSPSSFTGNVLVLGDHGIEPCPDNTYLAMGSYKERNIFEKVYFRVTHAIKDTLAFVFDPFVGGENVLAVSPEPDHNYCTVAGEVSGRNTASGKTELVFAPNDLLDPERDYYVVVKGDVNLDSSQGVKSFYGIGYNGSNSETFNGLTFSNAKIWQFTTMDEANNNGICEVDKIVVDPASYLFSTDKNNISEEVDTDVNNNTFDTIADSDKVFYASALDGSGDKLVSTPGYSWDWDWSFTKNNVVNIVNDAGFSNNGNKELVRVVDGVYDDKTEIIAIANISDGISKSGQGDIYVFMCENPWPPVVNGLWQPWRDDTQGLDCLPGTGNCANTNYEIYYCRDDGGFGTADDLPAILSNNTITRGTSDDLVKESYFFREDAPNVSGLILSGSVKAEGEAVSLSWNNIGADKYKIYYGSKSGVYANFKEIVAPGTETEVSGLENGETYYFVVTAISAEGAESDYSNEISLIPQDETSPEASVISSVEPLDGSLKINWTIKSAYKYYLAYNESSGGCDDALKFGSRTEIEDVSSPISVSNLNNGTEYCLAIISEKENNKLSASNITKAVPFGVPMNLKVEQADSGVKLSWDTAPGAHGYNIFIHKEGEAYPGDPYKTLDSDQNSLNIPEADIADFSNGIRYYFIIQSFQGEILSDNSSEVSVKIAVE